MPLPVPLRRALVLARSHTPVPQPLAAADPKASPLALIVSAKLLVVSTTTELPATTLETVFDPP